MGSDYQVILYDYAQFERNLPRNKGDMGICNFGGLGGQAGTMPQGVGPGGHFMAKCVLEGVGSQENNGEVR